ncbi:MAG: hypothetical protein E6J42_00005 [Chloroflexi bacterium]|nr:MAG: hypothetical protein E6J42_00005 [Chloroflexota bacterium]
MSSAIRLPAALKLPALTSIRPRIQITAQQQRFLLRAALLALGVRIALLIVGYVTGYLIIVREEVAAWDVIHETFQRWDANNFEKIVEHGYVNSGDEANYIVYLPMFPLTVWLVKFLIPSFFVSALLVSAVSSVAAGYFLQMLMTTDGSDEEEASRGLWFFFVFPTAYILAVPYTEALFMGTMMGSFANARRGNWVWCGLLGGLACATRIQGLAIIPALGIEAIHREWWEAPKKAFWLVLVPAGFGAYMLLNYIVAGDPLQFIATQRDHWDQHAVAPWETVRDTYLWLVQGSPGSTRLSIYEFRAAFLLLSVVLLLIGARWLRPSYQVFAWVSILFFLSSSFQISIPRYTLMLFPLFLVMARLGANQTANQSMLTVSAVLMGATFVLYATRFGF